MQYDLEAIARLIYDTAQQEVVPRAGAKGREKAGGGGLQTEADVACEKALIEGLKKLCPEADCLGEEGVSDDPSLMRKLDKSGPLFVIDPVDGTRQFANGTSEYSVMVSLQVDGKAVASWIYFPATNDFYIAQSGQGIFAFQDNRLVSRQLLPQTKVKLNETTGIFGIKSLILDTNPTKQAVRAHLNEMRDSAWAAGFDFASLIRGETQVILYGQAKFNDVLPWMAFLQELGYVVSDLEGNPYNPHEPKKGIIVAPNRVALDTLSGLVQGRPVMNATARAKLPRDPS
jgi:fructose-1,6-bisphosphatase/inositol monophosphatase family enzyme